MGARALTLTYRAQNRSSDGLWRVLPILQMWPQWKVFWIKRSYKKVSHSCGGITDLFGSFLSFWSYKVFILMSPHSLNLAGRHVTSLCDTGVRGVCMNGWGVGVGRLSSLHSRPTNVSSESASLGNTHSSAIPRCYRSRSVWWRGAPPLPSVSARPGPVTAEGQTPRLASAVLC